MCDACKSRFKNSKTKINIQIKTRYSYFSFYFFFFFFFFFFKKKCDYTFSLHVSILADAIRAGNADMCVVGGVETMSDVPIRFSRNLRKRMLASTKVKSTLGKLALFRGIGLKDLAPETPPIAEFSTNEVMGHSADRLAAVWGVSRSDQDEYALRSHKGAAEASAAGLLTDRLALSSPAISEDNGIKGDR